MKVEELVKSLNLRVYGGTRGMNRTVTGGYSSDLLSDVMGHAEQGKLWITLQTHKNVLAVASLKDLSAVLLVRSLEPEADMLAQAELEGIPVLGTDDPAFEISAKIFNLLTK